MAKLPSTRDPGLLDWVDDVEPNVKAELKNRYDELTALQQEQVTMGTVVPQLYGSLSRFVANPSTVSVETYKRILDTDETVGSGIDFINLAMISRFGDYTHPSKEIQKFVRRALDQVQGGWHSRLDEMFSAEWNGFSVTEQDWDYSNDFDGFPAFVPTKLITLPPLTVVFAVNRHGEVLPDGIYQYQRFHNTFFNSYVMGIRSGDLDGFRPDLFASVGDFPYPIRIAADLTYLTVKIPKQKCIHLLSSSTGKFDNPYGRSILRRCYKNWVLKDAFLKMWLVGADRKGTPLTVGYAAPNDTVEQKTMGDGKSAIRKMRSDEALAETMKTIHNSSFIVLPGRKEETYLIEAIQNQGDMSVFKDGVEYFNKALMRGMLLPPLVMAGGDGGGAYSLGQEHHKIFKQSVDGKLAPYKQGVLSQFIQKIIAYNFPRSAWEGDGLGEFRLEEYDPETMERLGNIFGGLTDHGYMSPENQADMDDVRQKLNLPKAKAVIPSVADIAAQADPSSDPSGDPNRPDGINVAKNPQEEEEDFSPPNFRV